MFLLESGSVLKYQVILNQPTSGIVLNKFTNYSDSCIKLADYTANICSKHKLNLIFSAESFLNTKTFKKENEFYKDVLKTYNIKLTPKTSKYSTYINVLESKLVIGLNTTLLREAFYLKKKVFPFSKILP